MLYKYRNHSDIPSYMKSYLITVSGAPYIEAVPVSHINDFLNGVEEWEGDYEPSERASQLVH